MRFAILLSALLFSVAGYSEVKKPGTFVPSLCGYTIKEGASPDIVDVDQACVGQLAGLRQQAIQLKINDGTTRTYAVKFVGGLKGMGAATATFSGANTTNPSETISGTLAQSSGMTTTNDIDLETSGNLRFSGPLEFVSVTQ